MHLPVSPFCFIRFSFIWRVDRICTHPLYCLAFLEIRQKVLSAVAYINMYILVSITILCYNNSSAPHAGVCVASDMKSVQAVSL